MSQIGTLETLIGSRAVDHVRKTWEVRLFQCELMAKYANYGFGLPSCLCQVVFAKLSLINSEMNCITKHKCTGEKLNATPHMSRATTYIFFCILRL